MSTLASTLGEHYQFLLSLYLAVGVALILTALNLLGRLIPVLRQTQVLNQQVADSRMQRDYYRNAQSRSRFWGTVPLLAGFLLVFPFCLTDASHPWWKIGLDIVIILMFYDFFYYLTHRFLFHDGPLGGPLLQVHAIHHQNKNPCRQDSNYLHPLETVIGVVLFVASVGVLSLLLGKFSLITLLVTHVAYLAINTHNHDQVEAEARFPFRYWHYAAFLHHVHHSRFTSGNYATITPFYDWLFGTLDHGAGHGRK